jgi:hypothetical protein
MAVRCGIRFSRWARLSCLLAMPGCSGEESFALPPVPVGVPNTRYEDACAAWARSDCEYDDRCGLGLQWDSLDQCVARTKLSCELLAADPGVSFDEERVRGCQLPSDCTTPLPVCWPPGNTPVGQSCVWNEACHSRQCVGVVSASLGICGLCVCDVHCPPGQGCEPDITGGTCVPLPHAPGEACSLSRDCVSGACASADSGPMSCSPFTQFGDPCGDGMPPCQPGLICDPTNRCNTTLPARYGAPCGPPEDGGPDLICDGFAICTEGKCAPPADDGQPCSPGTLCTWPAQCIAKQCVFPTVADCPM